MGELLQIDLSDVTTVMNLYFERINYGHLDNDTKKEAVEVGLKKYLSNKIKKLDIMIDDSVDLYKLVESISFCSGIDNDKNITYLINFLLLTLSDVQKFPIDWKFKDTEKYIAKPNIVVQNGIITHIETSEYPIYTSIFNNLYNYYINEFNKQRTR